MEEKGSDEKGFHEKASSPEEKGCNHTSSEPKMFETNQHSEFNHNITFVNAKDNVEANGSKVMALLEVHDSNEALNLFLVLKTVLKRHIYFEEYKAAVVALWIMKTWCFDAFKTAPVLAITALTKGAGKTQLLMLLKYLCRNPLMASDITQAALFRIIEKKCPTVLIDEADTFLDKNLRGVLNASFNEGGTVIRCAGIDNDPTEYNVFCDKAIAGIGDLPETVQDRSIVIMLKRKPVTEYKEKLRKIDKSEVADLNNRLKEWSLSAVKCLSTANPAMPEGLGDRKQDCWEPLLAIAELIGDDVAQNTREASLMISGKSHDVPSTFEELLHDIKSVFNSKGIDRMSTHDLIEALCTNEEAPWCYFYNGKTITPRQLAQMLKKFGVFSRDIRFGTTTRKGYMLEDLHDSFQNYLN